MLVYMVFNAIYPIIQSYQIMIINILVMLAGLTTNLEYVRRGKADLAENEIETHTSTVSMPNSAKGDSGAHSSSNTKGGRRTSEEAVEELGEDGGGGGDVDLSEPVSIADS